MFTLVGQGGLLHAAVRMIIESQYDLRRVVITNEAGSAKIKRFDINVNFIGSQTELNRELFFANDQIVLMINNPYIVSEKVIDKSTPVYNLHNGDTRSYRGISEICILAALANREIEYGITAQRLTPNSSVDSGNLIGRKTFGVDDYDTFSSLMDKSLKNYLKLLYDLLPVFNGLPLGSFEPSSAQSRIYGYSDLPEIVHTANINKRLPNLNLGHYKPFFPRICLT